MNAELGATGNNQTTAVMDATPHNRLGKNSTTYQQAAGLLLVRGRLDRSRKP